MSHLSGEASTLALVPPQGLDEICATFGDIFGYIAKDHTLEAAWQSEFLARVTLPFPLIISWDRSQRVTAITCHKLLTTAFVSVFDRIQSSGLQNKITSFGGCFSFRPQRTGTKLSTHAWGIAIDLNPETNQQGTAGDMDPALIAIFREAGFKWGGDWQGQTRDPMHFQFCTGY
ncbi:MAG: M15 family metallopeptidase [Terriglobales bacterium]